MCKKNENQALLTKKEFVDIINRLRESSDLVDKVDALFRESTNLGVLRIAMVLSMWEHRKRYMSY